MLNELILMDPNLRIEALVPLETEINNISKLLTQRVKDQLTSALKAKLPAMKIKAHPESGLILFYPLATVTPNTIQICEFFKSKYLKIIKVFHEAGQKDKAFKGIQMVTLSENVVETVQEIKNLLGKILITARKQSLPLLEEQMKALALAEEQERQPIALPPVNYDKRIPMLTEQPEVPYQRIQPVVKQKTRSETPIAPVVTLPRVLAAAPPQCHAADFGFTLPGNPLVTPIYCSEAAQRQRRAKLFVMFKGIRGVEESVERQFAEMLNPTPEGLLTMGMVNQPGVKLWRHPDALGDAWNLCALRFKRKGAAGWLRAITEPEAKVTVMNAHGKAENHYLFSLGKPKHK